MSSDPLQPLLTLPGLAAAAEGARAAVDTLLGNRVLRRRSADVSAESTLRGAWASAALAGNEYELADVRSGAASADPVLQGALRVQASLGSQVGTWRSAPRQVLARLHVLAAVEGATELGRPAPHAAQRLDTLAEVLTTTSVPAAIVAGLVHGEVLGLDAFPPSSGVVARAAARLVLMSRGLDPRSLVVLEAGHRELAAQYAEALDAYRGATPAGIGRWLVHCCAAVEAGAQEAMAICEAISRG